RGTPFHVAGGSRAKARGLRTDGAPGGPSIGIRSVCHLAALVPQPPESAPGRGLARLVAVACEAGVRGVPFGIRSACHLAALVPRPRRCAPGRRLPCLAAVASAAAVPGVPFGIRSVCHLATLTPNPRKSAQRRRVLPRAPPASTPGAHGAPSPMLSRMRFFGGLDVRRTRSGSDPNRAATHAHRTAGRSARCRRRAHSDGTSGPSP
ncbi:MAG: hypothetical protein QOD65_3692, partial [Gaiellales bacterium]|nr:hypothetical protein [Gaiellales bacterium]